MVFKFSENTTEFDFDGKKFKAEAGIASAWLKNSLAVLENASKLFGGKEITEDDIADGISAFVSAFDELLGGGATADIFGERPINLYDCYDVYAYIVREIKQFNQNKARGLFADEEL